MWYANASEKRCFSYCPFGFDVLVYIKTTCAPEHFKYKVSGRERKRKRKRKREKERERNCHYMELSLQELSVVRKTPTASNPLFDAKSASKRTYDRAHGLMSTLPVE